MSKSSPVQGNVELRWQTGVDTWSDGTWVRAEGTIGDYAALIAAWKGPDKDRQKYEWAAVGAELSPDQPLWPLSGQLILAKFRRADGGGKKSAEYIAKMKAKQAAATAAKGARQKSIPFEDFTARPEALRRGKPLDRCQQHASLSPNRSPQPIGRATRTVA